MNSIEQKLKNRLRQALQEQVEKTPKGIRIGDTYTCPELYREMRRYLGLCGDPYIKK